MISINAKGSILKLLDSYEGHNPPAWTAMDLYRVKEALRRAVAWLEAEDEMDVETVEENFHCDDLFDKLDNAREAFRAAVEGREP